MDSLSHHALAPYVRVSIGLDPGPVPAAEIPADRLLELADHHNLLPHLASAGFPLADGWERKWTRTSLVLATETARLVRLLEAAGIRVMPLKGPVLAQMLYGDPARRQYGDLDLIVEPGHQDAALEVLRGAGFRSKWDARTSARQRRFDWYEEIPLRNPASGIDIDLHWGFTPSHYPARMDTLAVWSRAERIDFLGCRVEVPAPEDYLEYLCLHAARHEWSRLGWLADLAACRLRFADRIRLAELARRESGSLTAEGLRRAAEWLGEAIPELATGPVSPLRRLRYRAAVIFIPTEADWTGADLPPVLDWLYYPLRAVRSVQRRLRRLY